MKLLALDTSSDACSVALQFEGAVLDRHVVEPRRHAELLVPMIESVLAEAGLAPRELDAIVLGNGPGSFIGMRIGASVAQGLCYGAELGIVPVSSLAAIAAEAMERFGAGNVAVAQDARMQEIYLGLFAPDEAGLPQATGPESITPIAEIEGLQVPHLAAGSAWQDFPALWSANRHNLSADAGIRLPNARYLLAAGEAAVRNDAVIAPESLEPAYIRVKVAEPPARSH